MSRSAGTRFEPSEADLLRYCRTRYPEEFEPTPVEQTAVILGYSPSRPFLATTDLDDVAADLAAGLSIAKRTGRTSDYFVLTGTRYAVHADATVGGDGRPAADVTSIRPVGRMNRRDAIRPAAVTFAPRRLAASFDLDLLADRAAESVTVARRRAHLRDELLWRMRHPEAAPPAPMAGLREQTQRHFQPLRMLLELLRERSDLSGEVSAWGQVLGARPDELYVRLSGLPAGFAERRAARLHHDGRELATTVQSIEEIEGDLVLCLEPPRGAPAPPPRARVEITQRARFSMTRHGRALRQLLDEEVEGNWENLAMLLCRPKDLPAFVATEPARYFTEDGSRTLNVEQRAAVAGALSTPHAYLIQGPPGTGKSTVIEELVLQLTARNERVLVLAPMHVAVDEVLGRLGDQPGVFALRMAADSDNVRSGNQRFLPDNLATSCLAQAKTPERAEAAAWQAEAAELTASADRIEEYATAAEALAGLTAERAAAVVRYEELRRTLEAEWTAAALDQARYAERVQVLGEEVRRVSVEAAVLRQQLAAVPGWTRLVSRVRHRFLDSQDEVAELGTKGAALDRRYGELAAGLRDWTERHNTVATRRAALNERLTSAAAAHVADVARRDRDVAAARSRLTVAERRLSAADGDPGSRNLGQWWQAAAQARRRSESLHRMAELEKRWFEVSGAGGLGGLVDDERLRSELMQAVNVVFGTTVGAFGREIDGADFDTLILDEASRVVDSEFLIGAVRARRWILVGDQRQLPPFVDPSDEHHLHALTAAHLCAREGGTAATAIGRLADLWHEEPQLHAFRIKSVEATLDRLAGGEHWATYQRTFARHLAMGSFGAAPEQGVLAAVRDHLVRSLFERCLAAEPGNAITTALRMQHRSIDAIASLVRDPVYEGAYETAPDLDQQPVTTPAYGAPVVFLDTSQYPDRARDQPDGLGFRNPFEVRQVIGLLRELNRAAAAAPGGTSLTVSILTFYLHQVRDLRARIRPADYPDLTIKVIDVIDRIQGQQSDIVIISFCRTFLGKGRPRSNYAAWLQDVRRLNVAVTRARRGLYLVGHADTLAKVNGVPWAELFYRHMFEQFQTNPSLVRVSDT
ncbi:AAA domain-containing protein [Actinoplanes oblitus]|uniref:AAA domain-containing protein n=1 Tax=Actinoplanes oblitus TaxID=3040509 RepID=A0ABY8WP51_9ACTN|nr:AAA domain-containing protein [Actinoplanes oblitus]WIM99656.1 AAA domain-containing protein [Actinoplanes oblitus]